jgi:hypothetical protein
MKKKCFTASAEKGIFVQNPNQIGTFDLRPESDSNLPFSYFKLSLPRSPYLVAQRALFVAESHNNNVKVLNTGLRSTKVRNILSGDTFDPLNRTNSLLLFELMPDANSYTVYLYIGYYPKSLNAVLNEIISQ